MITLVSLWELGYSRARVEQEATWIVGVIQARDEGWVRLGD